MLRNLLAEMARKEITMKQLSSTAGINERTTYNKTREISQFTLDEALKIQKQLFPELDIKYLFKGENK